MRNKPDKPDAKRIAQILRTGWFGPVHMKSGGAHALRTLLSTRKALLKKTMDLANEVRGLLKNFGVRLLDTRAVLFQHYLELDRRVKRAASQDQVCMRTMTVPGVGPITALTFKAAVDDPGRFKRSQTVAAHFGVPPRRFPSGEHGNPDRISKAGD